MCDNERLDRWNNSTRNRSSSHLSRKTPQRSENPKAAIKAVRSPGDRRRAKSRRCFVAKFQVHHEDTSRDWETFELFLIENGPLSRPRYLRKRNVLRLSPFHVASSPSCLGTTSFSPTPAPHELDFLQASALRKPHLASPSAVISRVFLSAVFVLHCERVNSYRCRR